MRIAHLDAWLGRRLGAGGLVGLAAAVGALALVAGLNRAADPVLYHHFALAQGLLADGVPVAEDPIRLHAPGPAGPFPYWLGSLLLYGAQILGGHGAVIILGAVAVAAATAILWILALDGREAPTWLDAILALPVVALALAVMRERSGPRPDVLAAPALAVTLFAASRFADGRGRAFLLFPLLAALWANVDPSVALGVAAALAYAADVAIRSRGGAGAPPRRRALALAGLGIAGLVASLASPWPGAALAGAGRLFPSLARLAAQGPPQHGSISSPTAALIALAAVSLVAAGRRTRVADAALVVVAAAMAVSSPASAHLAAILLVPGVARNVRAAARSLAPRAVTALAPLAMGCAVAAAFMAADRPGVELGIEPHHEIEPARAAEVLATAGSLGRVYGSPVLGGYLAWRLGTKVPSDVRPGDDPAAAAPAGGELPALDARWRFDALVLAFAPDGRMRDDGACGEDLAIDPRAFALVAYDDAAMLYVRREGALGALAAGELKFAAPCREISAQDLSDASWRAGFRADAERVVGEAPSCVVCGATLSLAKVASGEMSAPALAKPHPVRRRLRAAAHLLAGARAANADALARRGDVAGAISEYWLSIAAADTAIARAGFSLALGSVGEHGAARTQAERAVLLDPGSPDARHALGVALDAAGRPAGASFAPVPRGSLSGR